MAKTIPQLTDATTVGATDELIVQQAGVTKRATVNELFTRAGNNEQFSQNNAVISRLADRLFVDSATVHSADFPVTTPDWHGAFQQTLNVGAVIGSVSSAATTSGSTTVTFTAGNTTPVAGQRVYGNGIADGTTISTVDSATQITLSAVATATTTGGTLWSSDPTLFYNGAAFGSLRSVSGSKSPCAGLFATRTLDFTSAGASCIPLQSYAINNNATLATSAWALYLESHRSSNSVGASYGIEVNVSSTRSSAEIKPNPFQQGQTIGIQIAAGCGLGGGWSGLTQKNCSAAIQIVNNPTRWRSGIVFTNRSIEGTDGYTGSASAMSFSVGHMMEWFNPAQDVVAKIWAVTGMTAAQSTELRFGALGIQFLSSGGTSGYIFNSSGSTLVNHWTLQGNTTGNAPTLAAGGADTNVDLRLSGQGTGVIRFGTHAAVTTETVTGYITIKDSAGNTRKLAIVS
jgi:hypothetical protein